MKSNTLNSLNSLNTFPDTFSIFSLVRSSGKTIQTIQNYSESPKINEIEPEQLRDNHSDLFNNPELREKALEQCKACKHFEAVEISGVEVPGCVHHLESGPWAEEWKRLPNALDNCQKGGETAHSHIPPTDFSEQSGPSIRH